jgi:cbb3-type cytochrome oxidase cytochrome c subunit
MALSPPTPLACRAAKPMPDLTVLGEAPAAPPASPSFNLMGLVGIASLIGAAGGLLMLIRTRRPWTVGVLLTGVIVAGVSFALPGQAAPTASRPGASSDSSPAEMGRALFLAKGCVMCHARTEFNDVRKPFSDFRIGPDLSTVPYTEEYLHTWLKDPQAIRPAAEMPNLNLSQAEIEALAAFLKSSP